MGDTTIEWANKSWNVVTGCSHAGSPGCDHCYARRMAKRLAGRYGYPASPHEFDVTFHPDKLEEPLHWKKPRVVFPCSMSDWLHPSIPHDRQAQMLDVMADERCEKHTFLLLTKRPENYQDLLCWMGECWPGDTPISVVLEVELGLPDNIWPGVTVESQDQMWRLEELFEIPAARYWASLEPLLGPIEFPPDLLGRLGGVVVGGESGPGARPMCPDWATVIRDECVALGVPFTFKQWGSWKPMWPWPKDGLMRKTGKKAAGRELDGQIWDEFPWKLIEEG